MPNGAPHSNPGLIDDHQAPCQNCVRDFAQQPLPGGIGFLDSGRPDTQTDYTSVRTDRKHPGAWHGSGRCGMFPELPPRYEMIAA